MPLVKQNVMKFEVFILGGQRNDQKRKIRDGGEGVQRGLRWKQEIERKETKKGNGVNNFKRRIRNIDTCLCLLSLKAQRYS